MKLINSMTAVRMNFEEISKSMPKTLTISEEES